MATVVMTSPVNGGTYGTQADGSLVPFTAVGFTDIGGQIVYIYDDATNVQLGVTNASSSPQVGGAYSGWYAWSIYIPSWLVASGVALPYAAATAIAAGITRTAVGSLPFAATTTAAGGISYGVALPVPYSVATTSAGGVALSGIAAAPFASATTSAGDISIASDTTAPVVSTFTVGTPSGTNVPVTAFTGTDAVGVTGYLITESSTPPAAGSVTHNDYTAAGYTAVGTGSVTLYPWVRDAAGNVSSVFGSPRTVTIASGVTRSDNFDTLSGYPAWASPNPQTAGDIVHVNNYLYQAKTTNAGGNNPTATGNNAHWRGYTGANWTEVTNATGTSAYGICVNQSNGHAAAQVANRMSYWSADTFTTEQFSEGTPTGYYTSAARGVAVAVRVQSNDSAYYAICSTTTVYIYKVVAGTITGASFVASQARTQAGGDVVRIEATGTGATVSVVVKINGSQVVAYSDTASDRLVSGSVGVRALSSSSQPSYELDSWSGGDLA